MSAFHLIPRVKTGGERPSEPWKINKTVRNFTGGCTHLIALTFLQTCSPSSVALTLALDQTMAKEVNHPAKELQAAVKYLQSSKNSGPEGFPNTFFKSLCKQLASFLLETFIEYYCVF